MWEVHSSIELGLISHSNSKFALNRELTLVSFQLYRESVIYVKQLLRIKQCFLHYSVYVKRQFSWLKISLYVVHLEACSKTPIAYVCSKNGSAGLIYPISQLSIRVYIPSLYARMLESLILSRKQANVFDDTNLNYKSSFSCSSTSSVSNIPTRD